jgi:hypothetical protein
MKNKMKGKKHEVNVSAGRSNPVGDGYEPNRAHVPKSLHSTIMPHSKTTVKFLKTESFLDWRVL